MSKHPKLVQPVACEWVLSSDLVCEETFSNMDLFYTHVKDHVAEVDGSMSCLWGECDFTCSDRKEFLCHVLFHPYHSYQKCLGGEFQQKRELPSCQMGSDMRNVVPPLERDLKCLWDGGECGRVFDSVGEFYKHVHEHAMTEPNMCCQWKGCSFHGRDKSKVLEHTRSHMNEKVVACPTCGSMFASNTKYKDHLTRQVEPTDPSLTCSVCYKCYPNERLLREHVRRHINTFKCPHCELTCNSPSRLLQHIRFRHMESKPHECPLCQKNFKTPYTLSEHIESHRPKTYNCTVAGCRYRAKTLKSWQHHMKTAHMPDKLLYCCHICAMRFSTGKELTSHLKKTHGFELPPGHSRFRYVAGLDGLKRLQTVRLDDASIMTPEVNTISGASLERESN